MAAVVAPLKRGLIVCSALGLFTAVVAFFISDALIDEGVPLVRELSDQQAGITATTLVGVEPGLEMGTVPVEQQRAPRVVASMWTVSGADADDLPQRRIDVEEVGILRFDRGVLSGLQPGDMTTIVLPSPAQSVSLTVQSVSTTPAGSRQIAGQLAGSDFHPFVVTLSAERMFATVGTWSGTYNLRGGTSHAWVFTGRALNHHVDSSIPDFRVPAERIRREPAALGSEER